MEASRAPELFPDSPTPPVLAFVVHGTPQTAGSKRPFPVRRKDGRVFNVAPDNPRTKHWRTLVAQHAGEAMAGRELLQGPLELRLCFFVRRPKGHFGKKGLLPSAPAYPTVKPDVLKLARAVEDSLSGVVYRDDAQVVEEVLAKRYGTERVEIEVREL